MKRFRSTYSLEKYNEVVARIMEVLPRVLDGMNPEQIIAVLKKDKEVEKVLAKAIDELLEQNNLTGSIYVTSISVNYDIEIEEAIEASKYDYAWSKEHFNSENFPAPKTGKQEKEIGFFYVNYSQIIQKRTYSIYYKFLINLCNTCKQIRCA